MRSVHGLEILHGVPVMLEEDDRVSARQVEAQTSDGRRQEEHVDRGIRVEPLDNRKPGRTSMQQQGMCGYMCGR